MFISYICVHLSHFYSCLSITCCIVRLFVPESLCLMIASNNAKIMGHDLKFDSVKKYNSTSHLVTLSLIDFAVFVLIHVIAST